MFDHKRVLDMTPPTYERARVAFAELVSRVQDAQGADVLASGVAVDIAQQIWSALHGAVSRHSVIIDQDYHLMRGQARSTNTSLRVVAEAIAAVVLQA